MTKYNGCCHRLARIFYLVSSPILPYRKIISVNVIFSPIVIDLTKEQLNDTGVPLPHIQNDVSVSEEHICTLWSQLKDTVLLIGTLLLFDPVLFTKYEA